MPVPPTLQYNSNQPFANIQDIFFDINDNSKIIKAVNECPQVQAIQFRKSEAFANGKIKVLDKNKKDVSQKYSEIINLLEHPNQLQNGNQFLQQLYFFMTTFGSITTFKKKSLGFTNIKEIYLLEPQNTTIQWYNKNILALNDKKELINYVNYNNNSTSLRLENTDDIYIFCDKTPLSRVGYLPQSRLRSATFPINNIVKNYKTRGRVISKPLGILGNSSKDASGNILLKPDDKESISKSIKNYGTENDYQDDIIFGNGGLTWTPFMSNVVDMQLLELLKSDSATLCDLLGYEYDLLSRDMGGVALNNKNEAGKNLYQNHVIPDADSIMQQFTEFFELSNGDSLAMDYSHLPIMQEDELNKAKTRQSNVTTLISQFKNNMITYGSVMNILKEENIIVSWQNKFWKDLTDIERGLFDSSHNNNSNNTQNATTN